ncbi:MAG TPA: gamma-glutamyltransferase, partial [Plasticicumulans sp.]|nr:gamma-glutamyltransferase [Plasticicumulans sp.]
MRCPCLILAAALWLGGPVAVADAPVPAPEAASGWTPKTAVQAREFMVAAAHPLAVETGRDVIRRGGSAADAAIAMQLVLGLVEPQSSGLGGGAFVLYWDAAAGQVKSLDGRETAPMEADGRLFLDADGQPLAFLAAVIGGRSVGVPGTPKLLAELHRRWGRLPWAELFAPAIRLAREGFPVSPRLAGAIAALGDGGSHRDGFGNDAARELFLHADGTPLRAGERLVNPAYADTLATLAAEGVGPFYQGPIAEDIVRTVGSHAANPGRMSTGDLAAYTVRERVPVCAPYRQWRVCGMGPPSSGGVTLLQMLGILERLPPPPAGQPPALAALHRFAEAGRLAYADRERYLADPDYALVPVEGLLDPDYLEVRAGLFDAQRSLGRAAAGSPPGAPSRGEARAAELPSTSHLVIVDRDGNAVSMTTTIENGFGSRLLVRGFLLNNELTDFAFAPTGADGQPVANRVEPGKRPRSSMAPTLVFGPDGRLLLALGSPGGSSIINYVAKTLLAVLDDHLDLQAAIDRPNFGSRNGPTELEAGTA